MQTRNNFKGNAFCGWLLWDEVKKEHIACNKRSGWKMVKDDDGYTVRKYNSFCEEHAIKAAEQDDEGDL
jgi:hypothetical protein